QGDNASAIRRPVSGIGGISRAFRCDGRGIGEIVVASRSRDRRKIARLYRRIRKLALRRRGKITSVRRGCGAERGRITKIVVASRSRDLGKLRLVLNVVPGHGDLTAIPD